MVARVSPFTGPLVTRNGFNSSYTKIVCYRFDILYLYTLMFKMILYGFLIYLAYKFIFELVIPVSKATSQVKDNLRKMQEMQQAQQQQYRQQQQQAQAQAQAQQAAAKESAAKSDDYIDFEEVK
ncbi:MAG: DUF4834 family protein [Bacteroidetes bacterium]|nr:DUF4834 family protein [Bacteroidota bacterium]